MWQEKPFDRARAWIDLVLQARYDDGYVRIRGIKVLVKRGDVGVSEVGLADRWGWSRGKVRRFLDELETVQQIVQQKNNVSSLISIVNYDLYQADGTANDTADGQQTDTNKKGNKGNNKKPSASPKSKRITVNSDHHLFIAWWVYAFKQVEGYDYVFTSKDASQVKRLLDTCKGLKEVVLRSCSFLLSEDVWLDNGKRDLSIMLSRISAMPPMQNGQVHSARSIGIYPPEGISFLDWKPWENNDDKP